VVALLMERENMMRNMGMYVEAISICQEVLQNNKVLDVIKSIFSSRLRINEALIKY
jgi:hypothetical protein